MHGPLFVMEKVAFVASHFACLPVAAVLFFCGVAVFAAFCKSAHGEAQPSGFHFGPGPGFGTQGLE